MESAKSLRIARAGSGLVWAAVFFVLAIVAVQLSLWTLRGWTADILLLSTLSVLPATLAVSFVLPRQNGASPWEGLGRRSRCGRNGMGYRFRRCGSRLPHFQMERYRLGCRRWGRCNDRIEGLEKELITANKLIELFESSDRFILKSSNILEELKGYWLEIVGDTTGPDGSGYVLIADIDYEAFHKLITQDT